MLDGHVVAAAPLAAADRSNTHDAAATAAALDERDAALRLSPGVCGVMRRERVHKRVCSWWLFWQVAPRQLPWSRWARRRGVARRGAHLERACLSPAGAPPPPALLPSWAFSEGRVKSKPGPRQKEPTARTDAFLARCRPSGARRRCRVTQPSWLEATSRARRLWVGRWARTGGSTS